MVERAGPDGLTRPWGPVEPLPVHRAQRGEPCIGIADLIEWLLVNEPAELPMALTVGISRLQREGGGILLPAELDALADRKVAP